MKKIGKLIITGAMIAVLSVTMLFTAAEVGVIVDSEPVLLEALGSDGDSTDTNTTDTTTDTTTKKKTKKANTLKVKGKTVKLSAVKLSKKKQTIKRKKAITVSKAKGSVTFKKTKGTSKIKVSKKGVITVKKGLKKGTYKIKVKVTAKGNSSYKAGSKTATVTIKVQGSKNPITVTGKTVTVSGDDLASADQVISRSQAITVSKAAGTVTYAKKSGDSNITVNSKTGAITVKSGIETGKTYNVTVSVTAAGNKKYNKGTKTATVVIQVSAPTV